LGSSKKVGGNHKFSTLFVYAICQTKGFVGKDVYKKTANQVKNFVENERLGILSSEANPVFCVSPVVSDFLC
jgi:hypothetical protein